MSDPRKEHSRLQLPVAVQVLLVTLGLCALLLLILIPLMRSDSALVESSANALSSVYCTATVVLETAEPTLPPQLPASSAANTVSATPTLAPISVSNYALLQLGDDNPAVADLQQRLMDLGYLDHDEPSTKFNAATETAVKLFQRSIDVTCDGIADSALQEQLFSDDAQSYQIKLTDAGDDVKSLQARLNELGYYHDKVSGYYGPMTEIAVVQFQTRNRVSSNGVMSVESCELLYSTDAVPAYTFTPSPSPTPRVTATPKATTTTKATSKPTATPKRTSAPTSTSLGSADATQAAVATESSAIVTETPIGAVTAAPTATYASSSGSKTYSTSVSGLIECAKAQLGKPYVWSNEGPDSFDCSGLVYYCLRSCGISVSRLSAKSYSNKDSWTRVDSIDSLQAGDLLFFKSDTSDSVNHTAIYIGSGKFIHASSSAGEVVTSSFSSSSTKYWNRNFVCGRRVF